MTQYSDSNETVILTCPSCGSKNRVPREKIMDSPKCGKCHAPLNRVEKKEPAKITLRCVECGTKNRILQNRIKEPAGCGKCGAALKTGDELIMSPITVTDGDFEEKVLKSPLPVLLFAWAPWCPTCRKFIPIVDEFAAESKGKVRTAKINLDTSPKTGSAYDILSVPRILIFDRGKLKEDIPGSLQKHDMMVRMGDYLY